MDLPFLKLDSALDQATRLPESAAQSRSSDVADASANGFKSMLSDLSKEDPETTDNLDSNIKLNLQPELKPELKPEVKTETDEITLQTTPAPDATQNPNFDLNSLVAQLNLAQTMLQNQPAQTNLQDNSASEQVTDELTAEKMLNQTLTTNPGQLIKQTKSTNATLIQALPQNMPNILNKLNMQESSDTELTTDDGKLTDIADLQNAPLPLVDLKTVDTQQPVADKKLDFAKLLHSQPLDAPTNVPEQSQAVTNAVFAKPEIHSKLTNVTTTDVVTPSVTANNDQSKYLSVFNQLSQLVNAQTQNLIPDNNSTPTAHHIDLPNEVSNPALTENKLEIELLPTSSVFSPTALAAEVYNAKIKIYPPELGHITAELSIDKNSAQLHILTQNHQVKEIVEANLPQLKEKLQSADINLTTVQVQTSMSGSREQFNQQNSTGQEHMKHTEGSSAFGEPAVASASEPQVKKNVNSLVDMYA